MKLKKFATMALAMVSAAAMSTTAFAASWQWIDVDGDGAQECYYFTDDGNFLKNTTTPDGYQVNALGQWTENGVVQTKGGTTQGVTLGGLQNGTYKVYSVYTDDMPFLVNISNGTLTISEPTWGTGAANGVVYVGQTGYANPATYILESANDYVKDSYFGTVPADYYIAADQNYTNYSTTKMIAVAANGYIYDYDEATNTITYEYEPESMHRSM